MSENLIKYTSIGKMITNIPPPNIDGMIGHDILNIFSKLCAPLTTKSDSNRQV